MIDGRQQRQINEAAERFAEAIRESYRTFADRTVSAQELNAELTRTFFTSVVNNLQDQAEGNRAMVSGLLEQQQRQREASQALTQESMSAYMDFLNSMFTYYQGGLEQTRKSAQD